MREERASAISAARAVPSEGSTSRASRCTLRCPCSEETSIPGTAATPVAATAAGSCGQPSTVSWSVRASTSSPTARACAKRSGTEVVPSEHVLCVWRSMRCLAPE